MLTNNSILNYRKHTKKSRLLLSRGIRQRLPGDLSTWRDSIQAPVRQRASGAQSLKGCVAHLARLTGFFIDVSNWLWERIFRSAWENPKAEIGGKSNFCSEKKLAGRAGAKILFGIRVVDNPYPFPQSTSEGRLNASFGREVALKKGKNWKNAK